MTTIVLQAPTDEHPEPAGARPEGYDIQVAFDPLRAGRQLFPALDPAATSTRHYPTERHARLARCAAQTLAHYRKTDPELTLPDPTALPDRASAEAAQALLHYLAQPLALFEHFHSIPSKATPIHETLGTVEAILAGDDDHLGTHRHLPRGDV